MHAELVNEEGIQILLHICMGFKMVLAKVDPLGPKLKGAACDDQLAGS